MRLSPILSIYTSYWNQTLLVGISKMIEGELGGRRLSPSLPYDRYHNKTTFNKTERSRNVKTG